jgi:hypothetical protein
VRSLTLVGVLLGAVWSTQAVAQSASINGRPVVFDSDGGIEAWGGPPERAYAQTMLAAWQYLATFPKQPNGLETYFTHATFDPATGAGNFGASLHHAAGVFSMFTDSAVGVYTFTGDPRAKTLVTKVLDYLLAHGLTEATDAWSLVPYSTSDVGDTTYGGASHDGPGVLEPDKVGEVGVAFVQGWKLTGDVRYRDAAVRCAVALAAHVRAGSMTQSPWPFRVVAASNQQVKEDYCGNAIAPIRLFDELKAEGLATPAMDSARATAWAWLLQYPLQNNLWEGYFEDITAGAVGDNLNQYVPMETARYLLNHPERDPQWRTHAEHLVAFVETHFGVDSPYPPPESEPGVQWGATAVSEQFIDMHKMGSHTSRYASVVSLLHAKTGADGLLEKARRSLNWASYMDEGNGVIATAVDLREGYWFADSYGDFIRHWVSAMGANPGWAPRGEAHLLSSTSVVNSVAYRADAVEWATFDADATEVLRLPGAVAAVRVGTTTLQSRTDLGSEGYVVTPMALGGVAVSVRHVSPGTVSVTFEAVADAGVEPDAGASDAGPTDGGSSGPSKPTGCGCGATSSAEVVFWLAALGAMLLSRRSR